MNLPPNMPFNPMAFLKFGETRCNWGISNSPIWLLLSQGLTNLVKARLRSATTCCSTFYLPVMSILQPLELLRCIDVSPPGTPATKSKRQKLKAGAGSKDFTKAGLFHCKEGTPIPVLFPANLTKKYSSFFCFHNKKCSKPHQACEFDHIGRWDKVPVDNQSKILEHCHATKGKRSG